MTFDDVASLARALPGTELSTSYPTWVLVRLGAVDPELLGELLTDAWRRRAPRRVVAAYDEAQAAGPDDAEGHGPPAPLP